MPAETNPTSAPPGLDKFDKYLRAVLILSAAAAAVFFCLVARFLFYGFDFSDEAYYLLSMRDPWAYDATGSQFGLVYHPLYLLVDGNVGLLRLYNILILAAIFAFLTVLASRYFAPEESPAAPAPITRKLLIPGLTMASLSVLLLWLPTPNYNLLNYQSLALVLCGILLVSLKRAEAVRAGGGVKFWAGGGSLGWLVVGLGGFLSFMAKPTTAAGLAVVVLLWAGLSSNWSVKGVLTAACAAFLPLFAAALILDGSISEFVDRYLKYVEMEELGSVHSVSSLLIFDFTVFKNRISQNLIFFSVFIILISVLIYKYIIINEKPNVLLTLILYLLAITGIFCFIPGRLEGRLNFGHLLWAGPFGASVFALAGGGLAGRGKILKPALGWLALLGSFSFLFALGSNNYFTDLISESSFFLFLGFLIFLTRISSSKCFYKILVCFMLLAQAISMAIIINAWTFPFLQVGKIWTYDVKMKVPLDGYYLTMPYPQAKFVDQWYNIAEISGYDAKIPLIDLTGRLPGAMFILNGRLPKTAWMISGYLGSDDYAVAALKKLTCRELAEAWLILDTNFEVTFSPGVLLKAGVDFDGEYDMVGLAEYYPVGINTRQPALAVGLLAPGDVETRAGACDMRRAGGGG
ncbi:MAG: hypothetical protein LBO05_14635 [Deltaproteobacteria bacterium]|jgi:uncharacterized membrane protein|nr:hypothetical protein [Deltaproteobacteria bacterium]